MDTETTGLSLDDDIWEFAAIRREPDGKETTTHLFLQHDIQRCAKLPESFRVDHRARFPQSDTPEWHSDVRLRSAAAKEIAALFVDRPHVVGAVPNFDTERVALLLRRFGIEPGWHYHLIDVENLAVGYLAGRWAQAHIDGHVAEEGPFRVSPPWDSDELSRACGVEPPPEHERHTALGDARWAMRLYDAITGHGPD